MLSNYSAENSRRAKRVSKLSSKNLETASEIDNPMSNESISEERHHTRPHLVALNNKSATGEKSQHKGAVRIKIMLASAGTKTTTPSSAVR